jgi:hypothetical protein
MDEGGRTPYSEFHIAIETELSRADTQSDSIGYSLFEWSAFFLEIL